MANCISFEELQTQMFDLFYARDLAGAFAVAESASRLYPDRLPKTAYWKACILSLMGRAEEAVSALAQGLAEGAWWSPIMLNRDPDLEAARTLPQMAEVLAETDRRWQAAQVRSKPQTFILDPRDRTAAPAGHDGALPPLMLALHWYTGTGPEFIERFRSAADDLGFLLASAQSSQMCAKDQYCWDDQAEGEAEVSGALASLRASHRFDADRVILAGASQGGRLAIAMSLALPLCGFIAVVPAVRGVEEFAAHVESAAERGVKGYIIAGEKDYFLAGTEKLQRFLDSNGVSCRIEVVEGMAHTFPKDFPERLARAARFVTD
ncbi:MAG: dienelactone hydrolase family protein [Firmicutes bacterium]|jgi:predicted esterase|nr:dienelactone hydrolase family protein [Bacillota bacterium]